MFFLSRHKPLYNLAAQAKPWQRYTATLICACALAYGTLFLSAYLNTFALYYEHEIKNIKQQMQLRRSAASSLKQTQEKLHDMHYMLRLKAAESQRFSPVAFLVQQAQAAHVVITGCAYEQEIKKSWYTKHILAIEVTGSYDALVIFLEKIREAKKMVQCRRLSITQTTADSCTLSCSLSVRVLTMPPELVRKTIQ